MKLRLAVLLTALLFSALAFSQATLGNVVKLGSSTTAGLPASSSTIAGGLIYLSDDAGVLFNNGSAWVPLATGSSGGDFWFDAGISSSGGINPGTGGGLGKTGWAQQTQSYVIDNTATNQSLWMRQLSAGAPNGPYDRPALTLYAVDTPGSGGFENPMLSFRGGFQFSEFHGSVFGSNYDSPANGIGFGLNIQSSTINFSPFSGAGLARRFGFWSIATGGLHFDNTSGNYAISMTNTGARIKFSAYNSGSTIDYLTGDGTGIETPTYIEATDYQQGATGFCSGTACAGTALASFPAATGAQASRLRYDSTNLTWRASNGTTWGVVAKEWALSGYVPDPGVPTALDDFVTTTTNGISQVTRLTVDVSVSPSSASGNYVFTVYDATNATVLCTLTKSCASGSDSAACSGAVPAGVTLRLRGDSSGCGVGTVGSYNIVAQFNGG